MNIDKIRKAFKPSIEILEPKFFSGRQDEIKEGIKALTEDGSFIIVNGLRGVGKSSVAKQIKLIASGEEELVKLITEKKNKTDKHFFNINLEKFIPNGGFNFLTFYHTCDSHISNVSDLIK
jgi:energy-coupling factor transporter ATP-binding protein EcfA2